MISGEYMQYKKITADDAAFLTGIFSIPEYDLYFAENDTSLEAWRERITNYFLSSDSYIVCDGNERTGWIMYAIENDTCMIDIIVLHPQKRHMGYGTAILSDLIAANPKLKRIRLIFQKRNRHALAFLPEAFNEMTDYAFLQSAETVGFRNFHPVKAKQM